MNDNTVTINMFGQFSIGSSSGTINITDSASNQIYKFLAYIILNRKSNITLESTSAVLWPQDTENPYKSLRVLAFRARNILKPVFYDDSIIIAKNSAYALNDKYEYIIDSEQLQSNINTLNSDTFSDSGKIKTGIDFIEKHCGLFLENISSDIWGLPVTTFYNSKFLSYILLIAGMLYNDKRYDDVINICSKGLSIDPLSEDMHINIISALLKKCDRKLAIDYYNNIVKIYKNDYNISPTSRLTDIEKLLISPDKK